MSIPLKEKIERAFKKSKVHLGVLQGVRTFTKGIPGKRIEFFPSAINDALIPCESTLETDHCLMMELEEVERYLPQPFTFKVSGQSYTPDILLIDKYGRYELREVKPEGKLMCSKLRRFLDDVKEYCEEQGVTFRVITEKEIRTEHQFMSYKQIYRASHISFNELQIMEAKRLLNTGSALSFSNLRKRIIEHGLPALLLEKLLLKGYFKFDRTKPFNENSLIWA